LSRGSIFNRLLLSESILRLISLNYVATDGSAYQEGVLWKWSIARTGSIAYLISCIQKQKIHFPRASECESYLDEFACASCFT
jgi:hypothetical protein